MSEYELHCDVAKFLRVSMPSSVPYWHTHQSGHLSKTERGKAWRMGRRAGIPDWTFLLPPMARGAFIELKTDKGRLSDHQLAFEQWARGSGALYAVCRSIDEVDGTLRGWGVALKGRITA